MPTTHCLIKAFAVDADIVAYRCAATCENSSVEDLFNTIDGMLHNIAKATGITTMQFFLSCPTEENFRTKLAKSKPYKGNRKDMVRPMHLDNAKSYLLDKYQAQIIPTYEADDAIASMITKFPDVAHAGIDKDILQISGWHYNFVKEEWHYTSPEESIIRIFRQVCQGDASDNIPGLPGIGEAKAAAAITDHTTAEAEAKRLYKQVLIAKGKIGELRKLFFDSDAEVSVDAIVQRYFLEQYSLITMVDSIEITPTFVEIVAKSIAPASDDPEDDFMGEPLEHPNAQPTVEL